MKTILFLIHSLDAQQLWKRCLKITDNGSEQIYHLCRQFWYVLEFGGLVT